MPRLEDELQSIVNDLGSAVRELPDGEDAELLEIVQLGSRINYELHHIDELRQAAQGGADPPRYKSLPTLKTRIIVAVKLRSIRKGLAAFDGGGHPVIHCPSTNMSNAMKNAAQKVSRNIERFARVIDEYLEKCGPQS